MIYLIWIAGMNAGGERRKKMLIIESYRDEDEDVNYIHTLLKSIASETTASFVQIPFAF